MKIILTKLNANSIEVNEQSSIQYSDSEYFASIFRQYQKKCPFSYTSFISI